MWKETWEKKKKGPGNQCQSDGPGNAAPPGARGVGTVSFPGTDESFGQPVGG